MQRLALAVLAVAALVVALTVAAAVLRRALAGAETGPEGAGETFRRVAYALLVALVGYVALAGPE